MFSTSDLIANLAPGGCYRIAALIHGSYLVKVTRVAALVGGSQRYVWFRELDGMTLASKGNAQRVTVKSFAAKVERAAEMETE